MDDSQWDLTSADRRAVAALAKGAGEVAAAARLGISRQTLARVIGGLTVRRGTAVQVRVALALPVEAKP